MEDGTLPIPSDGPARCRPTDGRRRGPPGEGDRRDSGPTRGVRLPAPTSQSEHAPQAAPLEPRHHVRGRGARAPRRRRPKPGPGHGAGRGRNAHARRTDPLRRRRRRRGGDDEDGGERVEPALEGRRMGAASAPHLRRMAPPRAGLRGPQEPGQRDDGRAHREPGQTTRSTADVVEEGHGIRGAARGEWTTRAADAALRGPPDPLLGRTRPQIPRRAYSNTSAPEGPLSVRRPSARA